jgi:hypothetical protein
VNEDKKENIKALKELDFLNNLLKEDNENKDQKQDI